MTNAERGLHDAVTERLGQQEDAASAPESREEEEDEQQSSGEVEEKDAERAGEDDRKEKALELMREEETVEERPTRLRANEKIALYSAACRGSVIDVIFLLQHGRSVDDKAANNRTALFPAAISQDPSRYRISEKSVYQLVRSRQVAESHRLVYSDLDRLLNQLDVPKTDPICVWRSDESFSINSNEASRGLDCGASPADASGTMTFSGVALNHFNTPLADRAKWTASGIAASKTTPSWYISLRDLVFSESDKVGQGSFGAVFKGSWLGTPVVVKFMGYEEDMWILPQERERGCKLSGSG